MVTNESKFQWFALQVRPRWEESVTSALISKGYDCFLPRYTCRRRWMGRIREVEAPLFPGYLFCRFDFGVGPRIVTTPGFVRVVGFGKTPTPVEASEIRAVQTMIQSGLLVEPHPFLRIGQRVRLLDGPLSGLEGILVRIKNSHRLVVSVTLLQRSLAVEIETDWAASAPFMPVAVAS